MTNGFTQQPQQGLLPHERGLYTSPDPKVASGYGATQDGYRVKPGVVLAVSIPSKTPHVITSTSMAHRTKIKNETDVMNRNFGKGNYSVTGPQSSQNRAPETITQFPIASKTKSQKLPKQPTLDTMGNFEPGSDIRRKHQVKYTHEVVSVERFYHNPVPEKATITKFQSISLKSAKPVIKRKKQSPH
ncbi:13379_t:CDS:1 [Ambispora leptoticha]|uniref:13379_t:CDS:1 n=1 Tax=Ambispora leptoticha TaxID=144679 RepID=A0A9N9G049_9GLOM|nr:13379_t:CDS:1 [Ambispora leptoticha]